VDFSGANRAIRHATERGNRANQAFALRVLQQPLARSYKGLR
jgi:hypothetical protein